MPSMFCQKQVLKDKLAHRHPAEEEAYQTKTLLEVAQLPCC